MKFPSDNLRAVLDAYKVLLAALTAAEEDQRMQFDMGMGMLSDAVARLRREDWKIQRAHARQKGGRDHCN